MELPLLRLDSEPRSCRLGYLADPAFSFYYPENLESLRRDGADLIAVVARGITAAEPVGSLLHGTRAADVLCSLIDGELCYARPEVPPCA